MASVSMRELLEAGVHFGHQTERWNPKMKPYIFTQRKGIYIVDLRQTLVAFREALQFLEEVAAAGGQVLFVGTKRQAQETVEDAARRTGMYWVNQRWLGGLLTNFETIRQSVGRLKNLEAMIEDGRVELLPKKEAISLRRELSKLERNLAGIKEMSRLPDAIFIVDVRRERIAVLEAMRLGIPIVAIVDTNCDPEGIDFVVPGNDDALRAVRLFVGLAADAIEEGCQLHEREMEAAQAEETAPEGEADNSGEASGEEGKAPDTSEAEGDDKGGEESGEGEKPASDEEPAKE